MKQSSSGMMRGVFIAAMAAVGNVMPNINAGTARNPRDIRARNGVKQSGVAAAKRAKMKRKRIQLHGG